MPNNNGGVKSRQQMADEYGVCRKTFNKLLLKKNIRLDRGVIYPREQILIYNELGLPNGQQRLFGVPKNSH